MKHPTRT